MIRVCMYVSDIYSLLRFIMIRTGIHSILVFKTTYYCGTEPGNLEQEEQSVFDASYREKSGTQNNPERCEITRDDARRILSFCRFSYYLLLIA